MGKVIDVTSIVRNKDAEALDQSRRHLRDGLIAPADNEVVNELAKEHTSEPVKNIDDINAISEWYIARGRYRDNMLFIVGINFGLRVSDLLSLRFSNLIDDQNRFKTTFPILEKKTKGTRKVQKNRYITINDAVVDAVTLFLENTPGVKLDDYMFKGESNRCGKGNGKPMHRNSADRILKEAGEALELPIHISTHTLRKTFAYHQMAMSGNDPRKLLLLQKIFGHSTATQTLDYIGITSEEMMQAYMDLNLGMKRTDHLVDSSLEEKAAG